MKNHNGSAILMMMIFSVVIAVTIMASLQGTTAINSTIVSSTREATSRNNMTITAMKLGATLRDAPFVTEPIYHCSTAGVSVPLTSIPGYASADPNTTLTCYDSGVNYVLNLTEKAATPTQKGSSVALEVICKNPQVTYETLTETGTTGSTSCCDSASGYSYSSAAAYGGATVTSDTKCCYAHAPTTPLSNYTVNMPNFNMTTAKHSDWHGNIQYTMTCATGYTISGCSMSGGCCGGGTCHVYPAGWFYWNYTPKNCSASVGGRCTCVADAPSCQVACGKQQITSKTCN